MIDGIITSVGDKIKATLQATIGQWFSLDWIPEIFFWYWWLFVFFVFCGIVIWFFGWSKIVRIAASMAFLFAAIAVAAARYYQYRLDVRAKAKAERDKLKKKPGRPKPPNNSGPFGNWGSS